MTETQIKIIEAAEAVFAKHGFEGASVREITRRANVNIAAVNYHFGSKAELFKEMLRYRMAPLNQTRLALLDQAYAASGGQPLPTRRIVEIIIHPLFEAMLSADSRQTHFMQALGRGLTEERSFIASMRDEILADVIARFRDALGRTLSHLPGDELAYCFHFLSCSIVGAMMQHSQLYSNYQGCICHGNEGLVADRLVTYIAGGIEAIAANVAKP